jgi:hypothetical protein
MKAIEGVNKPDMEVIASSQREMEYQIKAANIVIQAFAIASKNKRTMIGLEKMNIMDDSTAIDLGLGNPEDDKVKCREREMLVTRADCLDYSGTHLDDCDGCDQFSKSRAVCLPVA